MVLLNFWREILIGFLVAACFILYKTCDRTTTIQSPPITVERIVTKIITKTVTTKPDGTVVAEDKEESGVSQVPKVTPIIKVNPYKYSVGVSIRNLEYEDFFVDIGARLGNTPLVAFAGYGYVDNSFLLGLRYEW